MGYYDNILDPCFCISEGRYVVMVSLYDRLGGNILRWSKMKGQHWGGATLPIHHDGSFYNIEMKVSLLMLSKYFSMWGLTV